MASSLSATPPLTFIQCFKYIVSDPPRPLNEEDIWFQIGHVHEQQKDVSPLIWVLSLSNTPPSLRAPRMLTDAYLSATRSTPKSCNSLAGYIISRATRTVASSKRLSTLSNLSALVSTSSPHLTKPNTLLRQPRRPELVFARALLHGTTKVSQGL